MKAFSVRLKDPLHQTASQKAEELGVPITELVRQALDSFCTAGDALTSTTSQPCVETALRTDLLESQLELTQQQIVTKDKQIEELLKQQNQSQQLAAMQQQTVDKLTEQNHLLLEKKVSFWRRLIGQHT